MYRKSKLIILSHVLFCNDLSISVNVEHPLCVKAYCFCLIKYNMLMTWPSKSFEACQAQLRTFIISMKLSKSYNTYKLNYIREQQNMWSLYRMWLCQEKKNQKRAFRRQTSEGPKFFLQYIFIRCMGKLLFVIYVYKSYIAYIYRV